MKDKIFLINCLKNDINYLNSFFHGTSEEFDMAEIINTRNLPIGLMSIEAYLKKDNKNVEIDILDLNLEFLSNYFEFDDDKIRIKKNINSNVDNFLVKTLKQNIFNFKPTIIGISLLFDSGLKNMLYISRIIKKNTENVILIAGGHVPHNLYKDIYNKDDSLDAICLGEGELPFSELLKCEDKISYLKNSDYFVTQEKIDSCKLGVSNIEDLDNIPIYNYKKFIDKYGRFATYYPKRFMYPDNTKYNTITFFTSRGCIFNCVFCASSRIHGKKIRKYSLDRVKKEIDYLIEQCDVNLISIDDDHFLFDVDRAIEVIDYIGSKNIYMEFTSSLAIYPINKKFINALIRNNVKVVQLSLESGSEHVLRNIIEKPLTLKKATNVFNMFKDTDIFVISNVVIGFPDETEDNINETINYLLNSNIHWIQCFSPSPISGSRLYELSIKNGYLDNNYDVTESLISKNVFKNTMVSEDKLRKIRYYLNLKINFVNNYHIRNKKYKLIIVRFLQITKKHPNHAFAFYCLYTCMVNLKYNQSEIDIIKNKYNEILIQSEFWLNYAIEFNLPTSL